MNAPDVHVREVFIQLADTLVADFDVIDFLDTLAKRCVQLLDVTACGLLLVDHHDTLTMVAASTEGARLLELFQLQNSAWLSRASRPTCRPLPWRGLVCSRELACAGIDQPLLRGGSGQACPPLDSAHTCASRGEAGPWSRVL